MCVVKKPMNFCAVPNILFKTQKPMMMRYAASFHRGTAAPALTPSLNLLRWRGIMAFTDRDVRCVGCGAQFVFSAGEQQFFQEKGFTNEPKHCKQCKAKRQGGGGRRTNETHVTCSECGSDTTVPFKPTQGRPVMCRTCFANRPKAPNIVAA